MKNFLKKFTGTEVPLLEVTEAAQEKIHAVIQTEEVEVEGLRIGIQGRTATASSTASAWLPKFKTMMLSLHVRILKSSSMQKAHQISKGQLLIMLRT